MLPRRKQPRIEVALKINKAMSKKFWIELSSREQETVSTLTEKICIDYH